jgi:hypothetical protein
VADQQPRVEPAAIERLLLDALATAARLDGRTLRRDTPLLAAGVDSLTFLAALTQIELACGLSFDDDELLELLRAADVRALAALIVSKLEASLRTESR